MKNVQNHSRHNQTSKKYRQAAALLQPIQVHTVDANSQGRKRGKKRITTTGTQEPITDNFLKCRFLPKLCVSKSLPKKFNSEKVELTIQQSFSFLQKQYNVELSSYPGISYPYNVALTFQEAIQKNNELDWGWDAVRIIEEDGEIFLRAEEKMPIGNTLYYISVCGMYSLLKRPRFRKGAVLLLSVCTYLFRVAQVPYYREEDSAIYYEYTWFQEIMEEEKDEHDPEDAAEPQRAEWIGDLMQKRISNRKNLDFFAQRITRFLARNEYEAACLKVAKIAFDLYQEFPTESLFRNVNCAIDEEGNYSEEFHMEKYVAFVADTEGWLYNMLFRSVNDDAANFELQVPTIYYCFNGTNATGTFELEIRILELMEELATTIETWRKQEI